MSQAVNENPTIEEQTWWYGKGLAVRKDHAAYLREWAADIRKSSGRSVDADQLDSAAAHIEGLEAARERPTSTDAYEASALFPGIYRLHWIEGGSSLAAVGMLHDGTRWFAPINWTGIVEERVASVKWEMVERAEVIVDPALTETENG